MQLENIHRIFFIGIGGIGMSALARYFNAKGKVVSGYDKTSTLLTHELEQEGISITFEDSIDTLMLNADLVVYTPAIPQSHTQLNYYRDHHYLLKKRAEVLGALSNTHYNICIAGAHGKTSTTTLTALLLKEGHKDVTAFLGGISLNFNSNFVDGNQYAVVEADEYDHSFLHLTPDIALVTSIDTDHLDIYGNFEAIQQSFTQFLSQVRYPGIIIINQKIDPKVLPSGITHHTYSYDDLKADYFASNIKSEEGISYFDLHTPHGIFKNIILNYGGKHNIENAVGASALALSVGVNEVDLRRGLSDFRGVRRRFQTIYKSPNYILIDDYAHHPREIEAVLNSVRGIYPKREITVIFQPHLYSRTRDLATEFGSSLSIANRIILLPIYPARELPIEGVSSKLILDNISIENKEIVSKEDLIAYLKNHVNPGIIMTVGAGDIDQLTWPISELLKTIDQA